MANLYQKYCDEIRSKLQKDLEIKNPMAVPKISKITINMGVGEAISDRKIMDAAVADMTAIAGQQPVICLRVVLRLDSRFARVIPSAAR